MKEWSFTSPNGEIVCLNQEKCFKQKMLVTNLEKFLREKIQLTLRVANMKCRKRYSVVVLFLYICDFKYGKNKKSSNNLLKDAHNI